MSDARVCVYCGGDGITNPCLFCRKEIDVAPELTDPPVLRLELADGRIYFDPPLLDAARARDERDQAIGSVEANASEEFKVAALSSLHELALERAMLCADDVWLMRSKWPPTHDKRALGPVFLTAKRNRWIEPTDTFKPTAQVARHAIPIRYWRSLIQRLAHNE